MEKLSIIKMSVLPKVIYKFNIISIKISKVLFLEFDNLILKSNRKKKRHKNRRAKKIFLKNFLL